MICETVDKLAPIVGTRPACRALGASVATCVPSSPAAGAQAVAAAADTGQALSEPERERVLELLHSEQFIDSSPAQVWATLLDENQCCARSRRCTGCSPPATAVCGSGATSSPTPPTRARAARRAPE